MGKRYQHFHNDYIKTVHLLLNKLHSGRSYSVTSLMSALEADHAPNSQIIAILLIFL